MRRGMMEEIESKFIKELIKKFDIIVTSTSTSLARNSYEPGEHGLLAAGPSSIFRRNRVIRNRSAIQLTEEIFY